MRLHLRRCLWITGVVVALQLVLTFWGVRRSVSLRKASVRVKQIHRDSLTPTGTCDTNDSWQSLFYMECGKMENNKGTPQYPVFVPLYETFLQHQKCQNLALVYGGGIATIDLETGPSGPVSKAISVLRPPPVRDDLLNVHIVAHSHDDVGWLKTIDQYYTGQQDVGVGLSHYHGTECVRCVLNSTIPELLENPQRRFIFIEMAFFSTWWNEISKKTQEAVKELVKQRRLEFVIGGWCMSDSATTFYNDIIDQHTLGFDFIDQHFGPCAQSKVAWHVDQFGHSREHSSIFAQMGFDAIVLGRIDHQDLDTRVNQQTLELLWKASPDNLGDKASLFTHISDGYYAPKGFVMDKWAENKMEHGDIKGFIDAIEKKRRSFKTNHIMITMGSDFGYRKAGEWFHNIDKLIDRINALAPRAHCVWLYVRMVSDAAQHHAITWRDAEQHQKPYEDFTFLEQAGGSQINMLYSTPSCYFHHVNRAQSLWPTKSDDFFPYAINNGYWTGYFTSKGGLKLHVKKAGAILQTCKQMSVLARLDNVFNKTHVLKAAVGVLQHHDAITGTEKEHVVMDYNRMLSEGITQCQEVIEESYQYLTNDQPHVDLHHYFCPELNISMCPVSESSHQMVVFVYNPLSRPVTNWIRLPVTHAHYVVTGPDGQVPNQVMPLPDSTFDIPGRKSNAKTEAVFRVELPAMGMSTFYMEGVPGPSFAVSPVTNPHLPLVIENQHLEVTFDLEGRISKLRNLDLNLEVPLKQDYGYYVSKSTPRASGAYIFAPKFNDVNPMSVIPVMMKVFKTNETTEVHQQFGGFVTQIVRLYKDADHLELEWTVGPIPVEKDRLGKEVISLFTTDIKSDGEFYTDSNGREILKRKRDHRDTWDLRVQQNISGNYYPVTSKIFIRDKERDVQLTVLTDRCQGGSSIRDGQLELMVHRRTLYDDGLGVGEPLNERGIDGRGLILRGKHYLYIGSIRSSTKFHREKSLEIHFSPTISFVPVESLTDKDWPRTHTVAWSALQSSLPPNVQILSLDYVEPNNTEVLLLRLEHFYEKGEHPDLSQPATVELQNLFSAFEIVGIEELSLGANFNVSQVKRLRWNTQSGLTPENIGATSPLQWDSPLSITLHPMEIRTFHIEVQDTQKDSGSFFKNVFR